MIGKIIVHGATRGAVLERISGALSEIVIDGIDTTIPLQRRLMNDRGFVEGGVSIHYLERLLTDADHA